MSAYSKGWAGFSLVELLVAMGIIGVLLAIVVPVLAGARSRGRTVTCLSQLRQMQLAQLAYATEHQQQLVFAGDASIQGSWIGLLERYTQGSLVRRCPADQSQAFDLALNGSDPPKFRLTSYGINNFVSPTHAPLGRRVEVLSQVRSPGSTIQFVELAEDGAYAYADHVHVQSFFLAVAPQITPIRVAQQIQTARHGGKPQSKSARANYGYLDGHAASEPLADVYSNPSQNRFDPRIAQ